MSFTYEYTKCIAVDRLTKEINDSSIVTALVSITCYGDAARVVFKVELSVGDKVILDSLVDNHVPTPLQAAPSTQAVEIVAMPPYSDPSYCVRLDATSEVITLSPDQSEEPYVSVSISKTLTQELYVSGGEMVVQNAQFGDWVKTYVSDCNGIIPEAYRESLCDDYPIVSTYIYKRWIKIDGAGNGYCKVDTRPLNAKVTAGLCLVVEYHAVNSGSPRKIVMNYDLTEKL